MSLARVGGINGGHFYHNVVSPLMISCNFIVDSSNGNGLGIRSLKSNGFIQNVFMHTSATPGTNGGYTNPNPIAGVVMVQFKQNIYTYLGGFSGFVSPPGGAATGSLTAGHPYTIATLGNTTTAQWVAAGLPVGITPAVSVAFVATSTASLGGTGTVYPVGVSGITSLEVIGDTDLSANFNIASNSGEWVIAQFLGATSSGVTTLVPTAPANNSVVGMTFMFDQSSVTVDGI